MTADSVFAERAEALSRPLEEARPQAQLVVFRLGGQRFGCEVEAILEFVEVVDCTPIPGAPEWIAGLINLRGHVLTLVDVRPLLQLPRAPAEGRRVALVANHPRLALAIEVDALEGILAVDPDDLRDAVNAGLGLPLGKQLVDGGGLVTTLNMRELLNEEALIVNQLPGAAS